MLIYEIQNKFNKRSKNFFLKKLQETVFLVGQNSSFLLTERVFGGCAGRRGRHPDQHVLLQTSPDHHRHTHPSVYR